MSEETEVKEVKEVEEVEEETDLDESGMDDAEELNPARTLEEMEDDSEELWPDGPTVGQMKAWKTEFGKIYVTSIDAETHVVWRPLQRTEYRAHIRKMEKVNEAGKLSQAEATLLHEEQLTSVVMLFPELDFTNPSTNLAGALAGTPSLIAQNVMEVSGFVAMDVKEL